MKILYLRYLICTRNVILRICVSLYPSTGRSCLIPQASPVRCHAVIRTHTVKFTCVLLTLRTSFNNSGTQNWNLLLADCHTTGETWCLAVNDLNFCSFQTLTSNWLKNEACEKPQKEMQIVSSRIPDGSRIHDLSNTGGMLYPWATCSFCFSARGVLWNIKKLKEPNPFVAWEKAVD